LLQARREHKNLEVFPAASGLFVPNDELRQRRRRALLDVTRCDCLPFLRQQLSQHANGTVSSIARESISASASALANFSCRLYQTMQVRCLQSMQLFALVGGNSRGQVRPELRSLLQVYLIKLSSLFLV
jgi:hypothetical protein